jgi:Ca2+-binding RTX toxin-like protein
MAHEFLTSLFLGYGCIRRNSMRSRMGRTMWIANSCHTESLEDRILLTNTYVDGRSNIFGAGQSMPPGVNPGFLPQSIPIPIGTRYIEFLSVAGTVSLDTLDPYTRPFFNADGGDYAPVGKPALTNINSEGGISGIRYNRNTFLAGVFLGSDPPPTNAPGILDFSYNADFLSLNPQLQQTFFIGDGRTATGDGYLQKFFVPSGATRLFLGLADGYDPSTQTVSGPPRYYDDNGGGFAANCSLVANDPPIVVDGRSNLFGAGLESPPGIAPGISPRSVAIPPNTSFIEFSSVTGAVSFDADVPGTRPYFGPDGAAYSPRGSSPSTNINSAGGISGLKHSINTFLAGVFLTDSPPASPPPQILDFSGNVDFLSLSPKLQQTFSIGDGRTSNGDLQRFEVPAGATRLFLGMVDGYDSATDTISGNPGVYDDNGGAFDVRLVLSKRINGTAGNDVFRITSSGVLLNGQFVAPVNSETLILAGIGGDDLYQFDADNNLGKIIVEERNDGGTDSLDFSLTTAQNIAVNLNLTAFQAVNSNLALQLNSGRVFENLAGGGRDDVITGNALANRLTGGVGNDTLNGNAGNDILIGGSGDDTYVFGTATTAEADTVTEGTSAGTDRLSFSSLTTDVMLSLETSIVQTVHANRTLKLNAASVFENINGGSGNDRLTGNSLANILVGNVGNDTLTGRSGNDSLVGGSGDDTYVFSTATTSEADTVTEATDAGTDTLSFSTLTTNVVLSLGTTAVQAVHANRTLKLNTTNVFENIAGGSGNDTLTGNSQANILIGNAGGDTLSGSGGRDILIGGLGLDTLNGGDAEDIVIAGRTTNDALFSNLNRILVEWVSVNSYTTRISNLRAGVGSPAVSLKAKVNVVNDAGEDDSLVGGNGTDWYLRALDDVVTGLVTGEILDVL